MFRIPACLKVRNVPQNIIRVFKSRRMKLVEHVACLGAIEIATGFWRENLREGENLDDSAVDGRIIRKYIFYKWDGEHGPDWYESG
jgi:hypothetical protein